MTIEQLEKMKQELYKADYVHLGTWRDGPLRSVDGNYEELIDFAKEYLAYRKCVEGWIKDWYPYDQDDIIQELEKALNEITGE